MSESTSAAIAVPNKSSSGMAIQRPQEEFMSRGSGGKRWADIGNPVLEGAVFLSAVLALAMLGLRSMLRLELRWDTFAYHIPFAARRAGLAIPYELNEVMRDYYSGYPPLPDLVQGLIWRATGSLNATGVVNYLAFLLFLGFCHWRLGARFWIVALISLTAPMVLIHSTTSYVDLFSNSFLAIGVSAILFMYVFDRFEDRFLLYWALLGLVAAAWSKALLVVVVAVMMVGLLIVHGRKLSVPIHRQFFF